MTANIVLPGSKDQRSLNVHVEAVQLRRIAIELAEMCGDDVELYADMIEGETPLHEMVDRLHQEAAEADELVTGITERQLRLKERKDRLQDRKLAMKQAIGKLMRAAEVTTVRLPEVTYTVSAGKPALKIVDPEAVPSRFQRKKLEPDKAKINLQYEGKKKLPNWLVIEPAVDVVTARMK